MRAANHRIIWQYQDNGLTTICIIKDSDDVAISIGNVKRHFKDVPCRNKARMASLSVALMIVEKPLRKAIWEGYRLMTKTPRWKVKEDKKRKLEISFP